MKQSFKLLTGSLVAAIAITATAVPAFAQEGTKVKPDSVKQTATCTALTTKIDGRITIVNAVGTKQTAIYNVHEAKVAAVIAKAKTAGADTAKVETDLQTWKNQTTAIDAARSKVVTDLNALKSLQCSDQKEQYKQSLSNAKAQLKNIGNLQDAKKAFFRTTIKPDLQALRDQLNQQ